jgi:hypothetical protein
MTSKTQTEEYLRNTRLPLETKSYTVISHGEIIDQIRLKLNENGFIISDELYKAEMNGDVALGFMQIENHDDPDMAMTFNWTNSYNKQLRFKCSIGGFIYDNKTPFVSIDTAASWNRKHTGTALADTNAVIDDMISSANDHFAEIINMKEQFKATLVSKKEYAKLMGLLYFDKKVITPNQASLIRGEYDKPSFDYSDKGTLWEVYKMIMFGIADQSPKTWYKQQINVNNYIKVLFNIAAAKIVNEEQADTLELDVVVDDIDEQLSMQEELEYEARATLANLEYSEPIIEDTIITFEAEESLFKPVENLILAQNEIIEAKPFTAPKQSKFEWENPEDETEEIVATELTDDQIELIKEEHGIIEETIVEHDDDLFELVYEAEEEDEIEDAEIMQAFIQAERKELKSTLEAIEEVKIVIPTQMQENVDYVLDSTYQNKANIVQLTELENSILFELDTKEFFVIEK